jgi:hypothetical protein
MALDDELLPEQRWPHKSARGRVRPAPPPAFTEKPGFKVRMCVLHRASKAPLPEHTHLPHSLKSPGLDVFCKCAYVCAASCIKTLSAGAHTPYLELGHSPERLLCLS